MTTPAPSGFAPRSSRACSGLVQRLLRRARWALTCGAALSISACSGSGDPEPLDPQPTPPAAHVDAVDVPLRGLTSEWVAEFNDGDLAFGTPMREADGLGPLYTRTSCAACHDSGARGPGLVQKMVVVEDDGVTPKSDQSELPFGFTVHPLTAGGGIR